MRLAAHTKPGSMEKRSVFVRNVFLPLLVGLKLEV